MTKPRKNKKETTCPECQQPMLPKGEIKKENEYDHATGCPRGKCSYWDGGNFSVMLSVNYIDYWRGKGNPNVEIV